MAVPYPSNPNTGTIFTHRGVSYIYDGDSWSTYTGNPNYALDINPGTGNISIGPDINKILSVSSTGQENDFVVFDTDTNGGASLNVSSINSLAADEIVVSEEIRQIVKLTQAQYDALTPDENTLYVIVG
jgi:hypothetical protein